MSPRYCENCGDPLFEDEDEFCPECAPDFGEIEVYYEDEELGDSFGIDD